jgi:hypothetical protein
MKFYTQQYKILWPIPLSENQSCNIQLRNTDRPSMAAHNQAGLFNLTVNLKYRFFLSHEEMEVRSSLSVQFIADIILSVLRKALETSWRWQLQALSCIITRIMSQRLYRHIKSMKNILQHRKTVIILITLVLHAICKTSLQKSELRTAFSVTLQSNIQRRMMEKKWNIRPCTDGTIGCKRL